jgi:NAD(P)H-dependent FMN reductase
MPKLQVIVGTTRPTRAADRVLPWVVERAKGHGVFEVEVLDLRDWRLPFFQEHVGTIGDFSDPTYSGPVVRSWNRKVAEGDAFLIVSAEYNHSVPGELKNAIDSVWVSFGFRNKPIGFVGYSGGIAGGARVVEHLALIAVEGESVPLRSSVLIPFVTDAFDEDDKPKNPVTDIALGITLDDLALVLERPRTRPGRRGARARRVPPQIRPRGFSKPPGMNVHCESSWCSHT